MKILDWRIDWMLEIFFFFDLFWFVFLTKSRSIFLKALGKKTSLLNWWKWLDQEETKIKVQQKGGQAGLTLLLLCRNWI
jgi:hypothetical protein